MPILGTIASSTRQGLSTSSFESIATATPNATNVDFTNIPQTFKHLQIRWIARSNAGNNNPSLGVYINNEQSAVYGYGEFGVYSPSTRNAAFDVAVYAGALMGIVNRPSNPSEYWATGIIDIYDYTNTTTKKSLISMNWYGNFDNSYYYIRNSFRNNSTAAISSLQLFTYNPGGAGTFANGSQFALYGIKG